LFIAACLLGGLAVRAQAPEGPMVPQPGVTIQQSPKIVVRTILVNTPVTVRNAAGEMVHTLEQENFQVLDNGKPQKITHFSLGGDPISLVVVVDTSSSIEPVLPQIRRMGILISQTIIGPTGEGAVVGYDDEVKTLLDFTNNPDALESAMNGLKEGTSGSRLFDAIGKGVEMLTARPEASETDLGKRRVMLLIGTAHDSGSSAMLGEVLRQAQLANITIYALGISSTRADLTKKPEDRSVPRATPPGIEGMPPPPGTVQTPTTDEQAAAAGTPLRGALALAVWAVQHARDKVVAHQLEIAAAATGGLYVATWKNHKIEKTLDEMGGELHAQYTISYSPSDDLSGYHKIEVKLDRTDLTVRARPGYYLAGPGE
jgi:VWFA-related protein